MFKKFFKNNYCIILEVFNSLFKEYIVLCIHWLILALFKQNLLTKRSESIHLATLVGTEQTGVFDHSTARTLVTPFPTTFGASDGKEEKSANFPPSNFIAINHGNYCPQWTAKQPVLIQGTHFLLCSQFQPRSIGVK
jgi:hypothetical protein